MTERRLDLQYILFIWKHLLAETDIFNQCEIFLSWHDRQKHHGDYGHKMAKSPIAILCGPNSNPNSNPKKRLGFGYEGLVFCRNNSWLMENMGKWLTVPKCVLINQPKIPQIPQNLSAQKFGISMKKASLGVRSLCFLESVQDMYFKSWAWFVFVLNAFFDFHNIWWIFAEFLSKTCWDTW